MTLLVPELLSAKTYPFAALRYMLADLGIREGTVGLGSLAVSQKGSGANMSVDVAAGSGWVQGDDTARQGLYHVVNDAVVNVPVGAAHATLPRLDQVVARVYDSSVVGGTDAATLEVVAGVATAGATLVNRNGAAALPNGAIRLADVLVAAADTSITNSEIRDRRPKTRGYCANSGAETLTAPTTYRPMTTPDQINELVVPAGALLLVGFQGLWQCSATVNGRAAIFLNGNQLQARNMENLSVGTQAAAHDPTLNTNTYEPLATCHVGLMSGDSGSGANDDVTTGQVLGGYSQSPNVHAMEINGTVVNDLPLHLMAGGLLPIFCDPGTYDLSVQFKSSTGNVSAKGRKLWAWVWDPSAPVA